ncbi:unnamed protein product [Paramecium sonneborni]|uniref:Uncharacterized protein n=1 Tax=Paramecium sonneborni TaxID=65129 RepID=A0A8S1NMJ4_9CILI|nr:unnamed protein product [Paramecium sonneborni]CAD8094491.1 unnamed protein product [Paramecium sonneborni]
MGCIASKRQQIKDSSNQTMQLSQKQQIQSEEQSKLQMTISLSNSVRASSINNSKPISKQQQMRIEKLLFSKKRNIQSNLFQCPEEEQAYQRTIVRLLVN